MNIYTRKIAIRLRISMDKAVLVQDYIDSYIGLDWSEATPKQIIKAIDEAASTMNIKAITNVRVGKK
jgi:hypothetical protein